MHAVPCVLPAAVTCSHIGIHVDVGQAASNGRLGVYADSGSSGPGNLIEDAGAFTPTAAAFTDIAFAASRALGPGLVWLVLLLDTNGATVTFERTLAGTALNVAIEQSGTAFMQSATLTVAQAFGALPASYGAGSPSTTTVPPRIVLKVA